MNTRAHVQRWWALAVVTLIQLMVTLDATVINIALPKAQATLHFSNGNRQWLITAYAVAFGSLMFVGGRLSDIWGRRTSLLIGLTGFALASAYGGAAPTFTHLIVARALQGGFGALLAPAALAALSTTFTVPKERSRAFAIYGAVGSSGIVIGLLLGGALTQWASWRWCLYINVVLSLISLVGAAIVIDKERITRATRFDALGSLLGSLGLVAIVYGLGHAVTRSWADIFTIMPLVAGVLIAGLFVWWQNHSRAPLLPLRLLLNRVRAGSLIALFITLIGLFGATLFLSYFLENQLNLSPLHTGVDFLPMVGAIMLSAFVASARLHANVGPRPLVPVGLLLGAMGMVLLTRLSITSTYLGGVMPGLILFGLGLGLIFAPAMASATSGIDVADAGAASALVNVVQQIGGSVGTAFLNTVAVTVAAHNARAHVTSSRATDVGLVHGYAVAFWWIAAIFGVGTIVTYVVLESGVPDYEGEVVPLL